MKLHIINPNTSTQMTDMIRRSAEQAKSAGTELLCTQLDHGPFYANCAYDNIAVSYEMAKIIIRDEEMGGYDAYVVASFADPGLDAVRELTEKPVVGIAEAAIHFAAFLGYKFTIINSMPRLEKIFMEKVRMVGAADRLASIRLPLHQVSDFLEGSAAAREMLVATARSAIEEDGAEVIILGGGMLAGYSDFLTGEVGVPVLDGVKCAVKLAESMAALGLKTSKIKSFAPPDMQKYV